MNAITSVLPMGRGKEESAAKAAALREVEETSAAVREHDKGGDALRKARNRAIVKAARHAPATEIAKAADIKQSYVSRVIRSGGKPSSGSALDHGREPVNV